MQHNPQRPPNIRFLLPRTTNYPSITNTLRRQRSRPRTLFITFPTKILPSTHKGNYLRRSQYRKPHRFARIYAPNQTTRTIPRNLYPAPSRLRPSRLLMNHNSLQTLNIQMNIRPSLSTTSRRVNRERDHQRLRIIRHKGILSHSNPQPLVARPTRSIS